MCFNIDGTAGLISEEQLSRTFHYLDSDCPIYVWAPGGLTSILSNYFEKLLLSIGRQNVYLLESSKMSAHILQNQKNKCLLILISTTGNLNQPFEWENRQYESYPYLTISPIPAMPLLIWEPSISVFLQTNVKTRVRNSHPAFRSFM